MANIRLNNVLLEKLIENEMKSALPNIPESEKEILRQELRTRYNLYKSYTKVIPNFWKNTVSISKQSNGESCEKRFSKEMGISVCYVVIKQIHATIFHMEI